MDCLNDRLFFFFFFFFLVVIIQTDFVKSFRVSRGTAWSQVLFLAFLLLGLLELQLLNTYELRDVCQRRARGVAGGATMSFR